jgi:mannitol/fructose-specific phosphotransferase system IIA component (Ntr-type)
MSRSIKWILALFAGSLLILLVTGGLALAYFTHARAESSAAVQAVPVQYTRLEFAHGGPGFPGRNGEDETFLADALGIRVEDLQAAEAQATDEAIQQALDQGLITQEQADAMRSRGDFGHFGFKGGWFGKDNGIDYETLLAKALNISVDELQSAREEAYNAMLDQAVENGQITQDQAELIKARQALQAYIDPQALEAQALGISVDQLQSYKEQGKSMAGILDELGLTAAEVRDARQAAYEQAVQQAVSDGVITQTQADAILSDSIAGPCGGFGHGGLRGGFSGGFGETREGGFGGLRVPNRSRTPQAGNEL